MRVKIIKSFPFYPDGNTRHDAEAGSIADIPDALAPGLLAAGYIGMIDESGQNNKAEYVRETTAAFPKALSLRDKGFKR